MSKNAKVLSIRLCYNYFLRRLSVRLCYNILPEYLNILSVKVCSNLLLRYILSHAVLQFITSVYCLSDCATIYYCQSNCVTIYYLSILQVRLCYNLLSLHITFFFFASVYGISSQYFYSICAKYVQAIHDFVSCICKPLGIYGLNSICDTQLQFLQISTRRLISTILHITSHEKLRRISIWRSKRPTNRITHHQSICW